MSWLVTAKQYIPAVIGEEFGGGYFAGYISHTADGNPTHALIVAPRETGATGTGFTLTTKLQWKTTTTLTSGTDSVFDGAANTAAMIAAGINDHPAAKFCTDLTIGGFTDWYLPAQLECDIAYFNLKPRIEPNDTGFGANAYSVPKRTSNYTLSYPVQTSNALFSGTGSESFAPATAYDYVTSTQVSAPGYNYFRFNTGLITVTNKATIFNRVRAFRRIAL